MSTAHEKPPPERATGRRVADEVLGTEGTPRVSTDCTLMLCPRSSTMRPYADRYFWWSDRRAIQGKLDDAFGNLRWGNRNSQSLTAAACLGGSLIRCQTDLGLAWYACIRAKGEQGGGRTVKSNGAHLQAFSAQLSYSSGSNWEL